MATPSPDGTRGKTIVDKDGKTWAFGQASGADFQTLRDGVAMGGLATEYLYRGEKVYVRNSGNWWYVWADGWTRVSGEPPVVTPPTPTPTPVPTPAPTPAPAPTGTDARAIARTHSQAAITVLVDVMNSVASDPTARVAAARTLLELGHGLLNGEIGLSDVTLKLNPQVT